jgi:glycine cleavage system H protein
MRINQFNFPDDLYYDEKHTWGRVKGNTVVQGLSDFGQTIAREIVFVGLPRAGREVVQSQTFTSLESGKWVGRVPAMASGKIVKVNEELEINPGLVNQSPFEDGWLVEIEMSDPSELDKLMRADSQAFQDFIKAEMEKHKKLLGV